MRARIAIIDFGSGNLRSLLNAVAATGASGYVVKEEKDLESSSLLLLPGVGSAVGALSKLQDSWMLEALTRWNDLRRPVLGICLGAQLLFEWLDEANSAGLKWLTGRVGPLPDGIASRTGWAELDFDALDRSGLATGLSPSATFFFNHRYHLPSTEAAHSVATVEADSIVALVRKENLIGVQFHPEKSQADGALILRNIFQAN